MFGLRLGKLGAAIKAGTGSVGVVPLFSRDYEAAGSLGANATFARSSSATIIDHEGVIRTVPSGAARFNGLRYVRNLCNNAPDFSDWTIDATYPGTRTLGITDPFGGNTAAIFDANLGTDGYIGPSTIYNVGASAKGIVSVFVRRISGSGYVTVRTPDNTDITIYPTSEWQRFSCASSAYQNGHFYGQIIVQNGSSIAVACYQIENATGRADTTTPSEYVSVGVLPAPYHGANVDGIKYFATENGNSVVSNVVTEGTGAAITGGYLLMEPAATNQQIHTNNFASDSLLAAGTGSAPPIRTIAYADGPLGALSATRFQFNRGTDATGYSQAFRLTSGFSSGTNYVASIWVKSLSGSVTIGVWASGQQFETVNGGNAGLSVHSVGEEWVRINSNGASTGTAGSSGSVSFGLVGSYYIGGTSQTADVLVCARMIEPGTTPTSYIPTSDSAVTRAAESLSYSGIAADNETRAITDAGTVDVDDWDGVVDATINGADNLAQITSIDVYTTGERPA